NPKKSETSDIMSNKVAKIAVEKTLYDFDMLFSYDVPENLEGIIRKGMRVQVPFGISNSERIGVVFDVCEKTESKKLKAVKTLLDDEPLLSDEMLLLAEWVKNRTFCTYYEAAKTMLPYGINHKTVGYYSFFKDADRDSLTDEEYSVLEYLKKKNKPCTRAVICDALDISGSTDVFDELLKRQLVTYSAKAVRHVQDSTVKMVRLLDDHPQIKLTPKQEHIIDVLNDIGTVSVQDICFFTGYTQSVVQRMASRGIVEIFEDEVYRNPYKDTETPDEVPEIILTEKQSAAFNTLVEKYREDEGGVSLLYGVTGCGKTQVYLKLIDEAVKDNKGVIVMVPEISLTPQTLEIFHKRYGKNVAVFHSGLSIGERVDEWKRVKRGEAGIVVGTRSAVFSPVVNLGLIIMDEEQEYAYKSEKTPRYDAKEISKFRCKYNKALLVLASATPSVETFAAAENGIYSFTKIPERYGDAVLPEVIVVDMAQERRQANRGSISEVMRKEIEYNLENSQQSMLLINRRGYNTFVACGFCNTVMSCPHCSISLIYHSSSNKLVCHYCGYTREYINKCEECGKENIRYSGVGTQKVEDELHNLFPDARVLRMDTDCVATRKSYEDKLSAFKNGDYDILVGTQMIAKGLDFENVTLVGIISSDQQLYSDDFRSLERTFSLLTQVIGRAGRGSLKGRAIIQTLTPENNIIKLAAEQDYEAFYETEIEIRKNLTYPPYCDICLLGFSGTDENNVEVSAEWCLDQIKMLSQTEYKEQKIIVLGPVRPRVYKTGDRYRQQIIIKCKNTKRFREMIDKILKTFSKEHKSKRVTMFADINPDTTM
ncbi:MAG: primosomal protein N', partial [Clostridia bacterium]|nr:primosomal protein N' [Clostridia bacterium]